MKEFFAIPLIHFVSAFFVALIFGIGAMLVYSVLFVLFFVCAGEYTKMQTKQERAQMRWEQHQERKIEEYWGTIDYWENK